MEPLNIKGLREMGTRKGDGRVTRAVGIKPAEIMISWSRENEVYQGLENDKLCQCCWEMSNSCNYKFPLSLATRSLLTLTRAVLIE